MPASQSVSIGLIGAGRIGSFHAESLARRLVDAELVAIADPAPGAVERLAARLGVPNAYLSVSELLANPEINGVVIATPARFHTSVVVEAARAGKAVFCEKPMALTLEEADEAIAAAKVANVPLQVGFNRRWDQAFQEGRAAIRRQGRLGPASALTHPRPRPLRWRPGQDAAMDDLLRNADPRLRHAFVAQPGGEAGGGHCGC